MHFSAINLYIVTYKDILWLNFTIVYFSLFLAVRVCEPCTGTSGAEKLWSRCVGGHQVSSNGLLYYIMDNLSFFSFFSFGPLNSLVTEYYKICVYLL